MLRRHRAQLHEELADIANLAREVAARLGPPCVAEQLAVILEHRATAGGNAVAGAAACRVLAAPSSAGNTTAPVSPRADPARSIAASARASAPNACAWHRASSERAGIVAARRASLWRAPSRQDGCGTA